MYLAVNDPSLVFFLLAALLVRNRSETIPVPVSNSMALIAPTQLKRQEKAIHHTLYSSRNARISLFVV